MQRTYAKLLATLATAATAIVDLTRRGPRPSGAGGGLPPPRGNDRRPPAHLLGPSGAEFFVFNDFCDLCNIDMRNCAANSVFPSDPFPKSDDGRTFSENK